jgi:hypothetical protein
MKVVKQADLDSAFVGRTGALYMTFAWREVTIETALFALQYFL